MATVLWSENALADLERLHAFLARTAEPAVAYRTLGRVRQAIETVLAPFPQAGRVDLLSGRRRLIVARYRYQVYYDYHPQTETVRILALLHPHEQGPAADAP